MKGIIKKIFRYIGYILFRPIWWLERLVPRSKNIWVFGAWYGQKFSDNSKWLYEYVLEHNPEIKAVWITKNRDVYKKLQSQNKPVAMSTSFKGAWWCLWAKYVLLTSGVVDVNAFTLNGCKQIWLWHGMPLKKILNSDTTYLNLSKRNRIIQKIFNPYYSFRPYNTLTSSDFFTPFLMEAFNLPKNKILKTGLPRCDAFFQKKDEQLIQKFKKQYPGVKIFFYMPTFRMNSQMNGIPFNPFIGKYGFYENEFSEFLEKENIILLYKPHFADKTMKVQIQTSRFVLLDDYCFEDLYILLNNIDCLITDYSSVFFDFVPTKKPIYLFTFDYEEYKKKSRDHYFNMYEQMNGIICNNWINFYEKIKSNEWLRIDFENNKKFADYVEGCSSKKIVDILKK